MCYISNERVFFLLLYGIIVDEIRFISQKIYKCSMPVYGDQFDLYKETILYI